MRFSDIVDCSARVASVSSRNAKTELIADLLRQIEPGEELEIVVSLLMGRLRQGRVGLGPRTVHEAAPDRAAASPTLTVREIDAAFAEIAVMSGAGSAHGRVARLQKLLAAATEVECRFVFRLVYGELHQGAIEGVMVEAIARAASVDARSVRRAVMATGEPGVVAVTAITKGEPGLSQNSIQLFRPVQPMLAQPASDVRDAVADTGDALGEYKLDGARIQIHKAGSEIKVFSRRLREVTHAVPEVVELVREWPAQELIVDGEVIALGPDDRPRPFQVTMSRFGRKLDVRTARVTVPLTPFLFDILYLDGTTLIDEDLTCRSRLLAESAAGHLTPRRPITSPADAEQLLAEALAAGHEGVMIKALQSTYEAGSRGSAWFKVKPAHTLDLVILAADWGHGRRTGWLSNLHLGARDPNAGGFVMLGKTFKGLTDEILAWQTERLLELEIGRDQYTIHVKPELVAEIAFNEVQASRRYPGGLALRFARVKRYRRDKTAAEADTIDAVRAMHGQRPAASS